MAAKKGSGIRIRASRKGVFTAKAKRAGMSVPAYANKVLAPGSKATTATKKQALFAKNARKFKHK